MRHDARSYKEALRLILVELTQSLVKTTLLATSLILTFSLLDGFQARVSWSALAQLSGDWDLNAIQTQLLLWYVAVVSLRWAKSSMRARYCDSAWTLAECSQ